MKSLTGLMRLVALFAIFLLLSACASTQAFKEGNALLAEGKFEAGLAKLEEATKLDPSNLEYKIAYINRKLSIVNGLNGRGDAARKDGKFTDAEKNYKLALVIDPNNPLAKQSLDALVMDRRHKQIVEEADALFKSGENKNLPEVLEKLRPVLKENPNQRDALNLKARVNEQQAKQKPVEAKLAAIYRKPITLEFRDAALRSVFDVIAKVSGLNFFFDKDVRPDLKTTIFAKQTSIEDAIRLLLTTNQLEQTVLNENSLLIYPNTPQKTKEYQPLSVRTFYLANADVKAVSNTIKTILKTKDMVIDERLGLIIIRDTSDVIRMAERIIALQDLSDPEVMLDVEILEIKRSRLMELGVRWPDQIGLSLAQISPTIPLTVTDVRNVTKDTINVAIGGVTINAKKEDSDSNILANPRIRVRNKEKAKVLIGDRVPVITTTSNATGFVGDSVAYVDVGLKLEVEPNIYLDEEVAIKINLEVSNVVKEVTSKNGTLAYQIGSRSAATVLRLKDGETQVLAGLISDSDTHTNDKIPGLGDLPVLNRLFGSQKDDTERSEIVLSITPHMIRSIRRPDLIAAEFASGTEANIGGAGLLLSTVETENKPADGDGATKTEPNNSVAPLVKPPALKTVVNPAQPQQQPAVIPDGAALGKASTVSQAAAIQPANFSWQGPSAVKVGDQFSAVLRVNSQSALRGLPFLLGFDPAVLQVVSVLEGDFLKQANGQTSFSNRIDPTQGKIFVAAVRQNNTGSDAVINGTGNIVTVNFKAIKVAPAAKVQLLSISPEPLPSTPISVPIDFTFKVQ